MVTLAREFDACGEVRLEIGGPKKYRVLSAEEILSVIEALDPGEHVTDEKFTADDLDNCWPHSKEYLLQILNGEYSIRSAREDLLSLVGSKWDRRNMGANVKFSGGAPLHGAASAGTKGYTSGEDNGD